MTISSGNFPAPLKTWTLVFWSLLSGGHPWSKTHIADYLAWKLCRASIHRDQRGRLEGSNASHLPCRSCCRSTEFEGCLPTPLRLDALHEVTTAKAEGDVDINSRYHFSEDNSLSKACDSPVLSRPDDPKQVSVCYSL